MKTSPKPTREVVRSADWIVSAVVLVGALAFAYARQFVSSFEKWLTPDYSHGFLVPFFSGYLIYRTWGKAPARIRWPNPWGLAFVAAGSMLFLMGIINIGKEWIQGVSFLICLSGVVVLLGGWSALKWAGPAIGFLIFMFPLPDAVEKGLGLYLQQIAARASAFMLQCLGYPTFREGRTIHVKDHILEVQKACSGLSMLLTFIALSVAMVLIVRRPWLDKALLLIAAIPVAIVSNVIRITLTGVLYNETGKELGDRVFHDFAGWLMMPIALGILWVGLKVFDWVFVPGRETASRDEVIRANAKNQALLFMHAVPGAEPVKPAAQPAPAGKK
jgi:exosortase